MWSCFAINNHNIIQHNCFKSTKKLSGYFSSWQVSHVTNYLKSYRPVVRRPAGGSPARAQSRCAAARRPTTATAWRGAASRRDQPARGRERRIGHIGQHRQQGDVVGGVQTESSTALQSTKTNLVAQHAQVFDAPAVVHHLVAQHMRPAIRSIPRPSISTACSPEPDGHQTDNHCLAPLAG